MTKSKRLFQTERLIVDRANHNDISKIIEMEEAEGARDFVWSGTYDEHKLEVDDPNYELMIIKLENKDDPVGFSLSRLDFQSNKWELKRIVITKKGEGYGKEILIGLLKYAFETLAMNRFWLEVYLDNVVGIKLYEKVGFYREGVLRASYKSERGYLDQAIYSMLREEYKQRQSNLTGNTFN
ncbi:GNAT family N-acetyltransferase [Halobacillus halophilus]|uniref:GNAT family N-acetyltransferase n=1 Tax=Halobacillus halophilus TaxID=1570 RepID=UPI001CD5C9DC|nr:GNAT family protein [Halobacillus halophilus]MCA1011776.1 GNAT family N-acetyltransferase [Halobacillus halophilus]